MVSKKCNNFKIWLYYKNIRFYIFGIPTQNEARVLADKLERAVKFLKMESYIINTY
jgi:hypothetical protein